MEHILPRPHLVLYCGLLVLVEVHLDEAGTIKLDANALTDQLGREAQILQDGVVHRSQGTAGE